MPNANHVTLMGNVTRDPEVRYTQGGTAVGEVSLAINRVWFDAQKQKQEEVTFVEVTFWGQASETIQKYVVKGDPLYIEGRLALDQWDDKQTGQKRQKLKVVGEKFQLLGGRKPDGQQQQGNQQQRAQQQNGYQQPQQNYQQPANAGGDLGLPY